MLFRVGETLKLPLGSKAPGLRREANVDFEGSRLGMSATVWLIRKKKRLCHGPEDAERN